MARTLKPNSNVETNDVTMTDENTNVENGSAIIEKDEQKSVATDNSDFDWEKFGKPQDTETEVTMIEDPKEENTTLNEAPQKLTKISITRTHSCSIGGVRYNFEKGKTYNVPKNVKTVLKRADILGPI